MPDQAVFPSRINGRHMFFFAHPDDDCFTAGLLQRLLQAGADVHAVWVTSGDARGSGALREAELQKAMELLGLDASRCCLLRFPNRGLIPLLSDLRATLVDLLDRFHPDCCYVTAWEGGHVDHDLINQVVRSALRTGPFDKSGLDAYEFPLYNRTGPRPLLHWRINGFPPGGAQACGLPLTRAEIRVKRRMMRSYKSQWRDMLPFMLALPGRRLRRLGEQYRPLAWQERVLERPHAGQLNYEQGAAGTSFSEIVAALQCLDASPAV